MNRPIVYSATPTAFNADGSLDLTSTRHIFEHAMDGGVDALFVNGTTGEFVALDRAERAAVVQCAVDIAGPDRVIAHVGAATPHEAVRFTTDATEAGVTRLSVLTPYYMPISPAGVEAQVAAVVSAAPEARVFLYLFPDRTGVRIDPAQAVRIVETYRLAGIKISIPGVAYLGEVAAGLTSPRLVLSGNDGLLPQVLAQGGSGIVSGVSSAVPAPFAAAAAAIADARSDDAAHWQGIIERTVPVLGPSIRALKHCLAAQGIIADAMCRVPIDHLDPAALTSAAAAHTY
ncbi:MAG: dihydrodipicolinate synthase family protein [Arachnia sp.]